MVRYPATAPMIAFTVRCMGAKIRCQPMPAAIRGRVAWLGRRKDFRSTRVKYINTYKRKMLTRITGKGAVKAMGSIKMQAIMMLKIPCVSLFIFLVSTIFDFACDILKPYACLKVMLAFMLLLSGSLIRKLSLALALRKQQG